MGKELVISANRHETKVAVLEDDQLVEIYFQRANEYSLAGSIQKGRVTRVLPGMQSAFVDIGLERDAFLYVSDFFEDNEEYDKIATGRDERPGRGERSQERTVEARPVETVAAPEAPATERPEDGEGRDRRGRRSRRRRPRGRGLPESKYASFREETPAVVEVAAPESARDAGEFSVLPGESLAKYTGGSGPEAGAPLEEPPFAEPEPEMEVEAAAAETETDQLPEQIVELPDGAIPEAPEEPVAEAAVEEPASEEPGPEEPVAVESASEDLAAEEPVAEEAVTEEAGEAAAEETSPGEPAAEEVEPARMPVSLTATLREQGHRYLHRVSRRMRRKMRNAGPGEVRTEERPEAAEVEEPKSEERTGPRPERPPLPSIAELLKEGQEILVQIAKEPLGQKGARITSHIALPGRYVVYMPTEENLGVSRKIASEEERMRLKRILQTHRTGMTGGFIVRTAGEGVREDDIAADMRFLYNLWLDIRQKAESRRAPALIHHDLDLVQRILRDQMTGTFKTVWVDNEEVYESALRFVERFQPGLVGRVKMYTRSAPIFDAFNISSELEKALRPKVWLKSGGYIVINQTEALVAVDVNTGKFVGKSNRLEDTIVKTNTEAVKEIVRQIRLRDLGGIIVVDFIDMDERKNRQKVMQALEEAMRSDRAPNKILQFNDFGLVAITRKRVKQSLERTLCSPCPYCEGAGYVKSVDTIVDEILQEALKIAPALEGKDVTLRVNPEVAKLLKSSSNTYLEELEETLRRPVIIRSDPLLQQEKFDLV
jgi:Rne/Rng family ribonuclease